MLTDEQLIQRLRGALESETADIYPPAGVLASVHDELQGTARGRSRRWRPPSIGGVFTVMSAAVAVAVVVVALVLIGHHQPATQGGQAAVPPGTAQLVGEAADPRGGLPWGLRTFQATRTQTCLQVGRTRSGALGIIGQDNSFSNDGRFHPISPQADHADHGDYCTGVDAHGHAFVNVFVRDAPASASIGSAHGQCRVGSQPRRTSPCPSKDLRNVAYGLLGPDAVSITYMSPNGRSVTKRTGGNDGAYLVVLPGTSQSCFDSHSGGRSCLLGSGEITTSALQSGVITAVTYRDEHVCRLPTPTSTGVQPGSCPRIGYTAPKPFHAPSVTAAQVATPVTGRALPAKNYCFPPHSNVIGSAAPCTAHTPRSYGRMSSKQGGMLTEISFTARLAATNNHSVYEWSLTSTGDPNCPGAGGSTDATTMTPIRAGQHVVLQSFESGCPGRYTGLVTYQPNGYPGRDTLDAHVPIHDGSTLVGRFSFVVACDGKKSCLGSS